MKTTKVPFPVHEEKVSYHRSVAFLGSCFSQHLAQKLLIQGFSVVSNPIGVVFNPLALSNYFLLSDEELVASIFERDGVWLSYCASSTTFAYSEHGLRDRLLNERSEFMSQLASTSHLFLTVGTAWAYKLHSSQEIVANCHKMPSSGFEKELLPLQVMLSAWSNVMNLLEMKYPHLQVTFTISPVRHTKDGMVQNMRSKSRLVEFVHALCTMHPRIIYFPVFEYFMDELRDYAWYGADGIHPNDLSVQLVYEIFRESWFSEETKVIENEWNQLITSYHHRPVHAETDQYQRFRKEVLRKLALFYDTYPMFNKIYSVEDE
jgi:hypothetical protein